MKAKDLIEILQEAGEDKPVFISSDSEGNSYGTISPMSFGVDKDKIIIYPHHEHLEEEMLLRAESKTQKP